MPFELAKSNAIELQRRAGIDDAAIEFLQSIAYAIDSPEGEISTAPIKKPRAYEN